MTFPDPGDYGATPQDFGSSDVPTTQGPGRQHGGVAESNQDHRPGSVNHPHHEEGNRSDVSRTERAAGSQFHKTCTCCGTRYTRRGWAGLEFIGAMGEEENGGRIFALVNCVCNSTIAAPSIECEGLEWATVETRDVLQLRIAAASKRGAGTREAMRLLSIKHASEKARLIGLRVRSGE